MSRPSKRISPSERISRISASASVVLPEPDSPTTPSVSPARRLTSTSVTALMCPTVRFKQAPPDREPDAHGIALDQHVRALRHRLGPALRLGLKQLDRVGVLRRLKDPLGRPGLDDLARLHHGDALRHAAHDAEVVRDEEHREPLVPLQLGQKLEDLRLDGDIECGGRLVGHQELGPVGQRHGDHHALALAARELVRPGRRAAPPGRECRPASATPPSGLRAASPVNPWCTFRLSPIWRDTVCRGLSEVIGS